MADEQLSSADGNVLKRLVEMDTSSSSNSTSAVKCRPSVGSSGGHRLLSEADSVDVFDECDDDATSLSPSIGDRSTVSAVSYIESELFDDADSAVMSTIRHSCPEGEKLQMRKWVVTSILESERAYLGTLDVLIALIKTFLNLLSTDEPILCEADIDAIFSKLKITELHEAHDVFVNELTPRVEHWTDEQEVAEPIKVLALMEYRVAGDFLRNYPTAVTTIRRCWGENLAFAGMTKEIEVPGIKEKQNLEQMLYTPVVRFQRNTLVLHDLIRCTPTSHVDYDTLQKTLIIAQQFLDEQTADSDSSPTEQRYAAKHDLVVEKVGDTRKLRHLLLFNDILVCAATRRSIKQQTQLEAKWSVPLFDVTLDDRVNASEEQELADKSQAEMKQLQRTIAELQRELRTEMKQAANAAEQPQAQLSRQASFTNRAAKNSKLRKRLIEQRLALLKASPRLIFRVHDRKHKTQHTLLLASDYERSTWRTAIVDLLGRVQDAPNISSTEMHNLLNSKKLPRVRTPVGVDDLSMDDERLFGTLNVTICKLQGVSGSLDTSDVYCTVEVDSFNHFSTKAKTKSVNATASWDENFEVELEGSQTVRVLVYESNSTTESQVGMCALELSSEWLTTEFQEKTISINKEMSLTICLSFSSRQRERTLVRQSSPSSAVFGARIDQVQKMEGTEIPYVIAICIQEIDRRGLKEEGLYRISGATSDIQRLKKAFEKHSKQVLQLTAETDVAAVAGLVKMFFRELPECIVTDALFKELVKAVGLSDPETKQTLIAKQLKSLPEPNRSTLVYLVEHLMRVINNESDNRMSLKNLTTVFGPTLLRGPISDPSSTSNSSSASSSAVPPPPTPELLNSWSPNDLVLQTAILHNILELRRTKGVLF